MKYYINREKNILLIDENEYTSYLADRGYEEITKEEYDQKNKELVESSEKKIRRIKNGYTRYNR